MNLSSIFSLSRREVFVAAFKYSIPVLLGYLAIGVAFGLMLSGTGYPWWLALVMSLWMYAGAGQYIAVGLFVTGTTIWEACLIQLIVNARHIAYGLSMLKRFENLGRFKPYLIFSLTDETFALLSSLPEPCLPEACLAQAGLPEASTPVPSIPCMAQDKKLFMFYVAILDQSYWVSGTIIGAIAGTLIPFDLKGIGFALTALFVVLMIEQIKIAKKSEQKSYGMFILSAAAALAGVFFFPGRVSLLAAMALALFLSPLLKKMKQLFIKGNAHE